jgi:phosphotransferase system, enzyme I, PtsP
LNQTAKLNAPRTLMRRLREVMAEELSPQDKLDRIVILIANNMVAEVCSVYVARSDGALELYATEGLKREAIHLTLMKAGEGMIGRVYANAEPLNNADAPNHPDYVYKPETGEEIYPSFLGVPLLKNGQSIGVLVVQNSAKRLYPEEEVEALQTIAMVIAEMIASGEISALSPQGEVSVLRRAVYLQGQPLADGIGLGHVVLHEPRIHIKKIIADNPAEEQSRLLTALIAVRADIDQKLEDLDETRTGEHREILEAYRMFAHDRGWLRKLDEAIKTGVTAEAAVDRVQNDNRAKMLRMTDPYLRDRLHDLDDLGNRLLRQLSGVSLAVTGDNLPENAILVARHMGPAALLDYARSNLRGLILEEASSTSHVAIVARALGIATVGQVDGIVTLADHGDGIIVDGATGEIYLRPGNDIETAYAEKVRFRARRMAQYAALKDVPSNSQDGVHVSLQINAGLLVDVQHVLEAGAEGIGLFRTELQFMVAPALPRANEQAALYKQVIEGAGGYPVTFRTLDIGGDKILPYMRANEEENPAMGWRALRLGLERKAILKSQLRALLKAAAGRELRVMFPMVSTVDEFIEAKEVLTGEIAFLTKHGHALPAKIEAGTMLEVPSLLHSLDALFEVVDFVSIGSNDLMQFFYAVDRGNPKVAGRYDMLTPSFLRAIKSIADAGVRHNKRVTLCGEMASKPLEAMALIALGLRSLSFSAAALGPVKAMLLDLNVHNAHNFIMSKLRGEASLRPALLDFADKNGLSL